MASNLAQKLLVNNQLGQLELKATACPSRTSEDVEPPVVHLDQLPSTFSFSAMLSPQQGQDTPFIIGDEGKLLDSIYLITLALNEECRKLCKGCAYHMPLRQDPSRGHPCDLVFVDEEWGEKSTTTWDASSWKQRLKMCNAARKMRPREEIIPICCRVMKAGEVNSASKLYATHSDPAIAKHGNIITYSRPLENKARVHLSYANLHARPHLYLMDTVEHNLISTGFLTPGDLSETFIPHNQTSSASVFGQTSMSHPLGLATASRLLQNHVQTNRDVVLTLIHTFSNGQPLEGIDDQEQIVPFDDFRDTRYLWEEIAGRIRRSADDMERRRRMLQAMMSSEVEQNMISA